VRSMKYVSSSKQRGLQPSKPSEVLPPQDILFDVHAHVRQ